MIRNPERLKWIREMNSYPPKSPEIIISENVKIHKTAVLGEPGFGMELDEEGNWIRCRHFGGIKIGDNADIAEFVVVRRATLDGTFTEIGDDAKISAFVNVGHNTKIGKHVFIGAHACLNGSVEVGDYAWIAAHAVIRDHIKIGPHAVVGLGAVVVKDVLPGVTVVGNPARRLER